MALNDSDNLVAAPTTLLDDSSTLFDDSSTLVTPSGDGLTTLPVGSGVTLLWQGGTANDDPTVAANWNPAQAPQMAANQTLVMNSGTMNLDGGNLAANELNVSTAADQMATINLTDHGSLDLNVPATAIPNVDVNMSGGGEAVMNVFAGTDSDPNIMVSIDHSTLDLQANMGFGKLTVHGGTTFLQGDSHLNGSSVLLDTNLQGFGSVELGSSGAHPGRMDMSSQLPAGVTVNVLDNNGIGGSNGVVFDPTAASPTPGGQINLQDGFVKLLGLPATSYTSTNGEFDFYNNGVKIDALNIAATPGSGPLQVGSNANAVFVYNSPTSSMPLGAGNGLGGGGGGGGGGMMAESLTVSTLTPLAMHG